MMAPDILSYIQDYADVGYYLYVNPCELNKVLHVLELLAHIEDGLQKMPSKYTSINAFWRDGAQGKKDRSEKVETSSVAETFV